MQNRTSAGIGVAGGFGLSAMSFFPPAFLSNLPEWSKGIIGWIGVILFLTSIVALIWPKWFSRPLRGLLRQRADETEGTPSPHTHAPAFIEVAKGATLKKLDLRRNTVIGRNFVRNEGSVDELNATSNRLLDGQDSDESNK